MRNPIDRLTDAAVGKRGRWITIVIWLLVAGIMGGAAPKLANLYDNKATGSIGNPESVQATRLVQQAFPNQNGIPAIIVFHNAQGLSDADKQSATQLACWLSSDEKRASLDVCKGLSYAKTRPTQLGAIVAPATIPQASAQLVSNDKTTLEIVAPITISQDDSLGLGQVVKQIRDYGDSLATPALQVKVTGPGGILSDLVDIFASTDVKLLLTTVLLVLVLLLLIYRSPLLALLPIISVGWVLSIVTGILGFAAKSQLFPIGQQPTSIMNVLLFGAGTDYTIFIVARLREELGRNPDRDAALRETMHGVGEAITSSAGTVILSLLTLVLATLGLYSSLGLVLAIAVAVMLLAGLTLIPAILSVLGRAAFWPFSPKLATATELAHEEERSVRGFWGNIARFVTHRPAVAVAGSLVVLGVLALGNLGIGADFNSLSDLRKNTPATDGYHLLAQHFAPGTLAPFSVVVHLPSGTNAYQQLVALDKITAGIAAAPHVATATGPTRPDGKAPAIDPATLQTAIAQLPQSIKDAIRNGQNIPSGPPAGTGGPPAGAGTPAIDPQVVGLYAASVTSVSNDNGTVLLTVTLDTDPYSATALDAIAPIRAAARHAAQDAGLTNATVQLTGVTPQLADTRAASDRDRMLIVPLVLVLVAIVLGLLLRSAVAPLYLLAAVTLNFIAALGLASFIFTHFQGEEGVAYATPLYTFIFLVALGADYTIFLMTRVREEVARRGLVTGTQVALSRTGGVITSAGLILAGTFLVLTTLPLRTLSDFGTAVALGVLLDTFIVRGLLVPGVVVLLGKANWWPGKLPEAQTTTH